jgi:hypothetical protein
MPGRHYLPLSAERGEPVRLGHPVAVKAPDDQVLGTILNPRFDVTRAALFDT